MTTLATDLKAGMFIKEGKDLYHVLESAYHAGTAKMPGGVHVKLKNVATGHLLDRRVKPEDKFSEIELDSQNNLEFLYEADDLCYYMNPENFEQFPVPKNMLGKAVDFPLSKIKISVQFYEGKPVHVLLPQAVELEVVTTAASAHHEQDNTMKSATLENKMEILIPQFVKQGEIVRVEIESGKYLDRVKTKK